MQAHWSVDVHAVLQSMQIGTVATVPDGGLMELLNLCEADDATRVVTLSSEQEGIGLAFGLWLGGRRAAIFIQSSGVGNCINALSLPATTRTPCLLLVTMRGEKGEKNPWQVPMGEATPSVFDAMGVRCFSPADAGQVGPMFAEAATCAFGQSGRAAVLVHQHIIGTKEFSK